MWIALSLLAGALFLGGRTTYVVNQVKQEPPKKPRKLTKKEKKILALKEELHNLEPEREYSINTLDF